MNLTGLTWIAVDFLAVLGKLDKQCTLSEVCSKINKSQKYAEVVLAKLKKAGLVNSYRGVKGGYTLAKPISEITITEVILATEGEIFTVEQDGTPRSLVRLAVVEAVKSRMDAMTLEKVINGSRI
jgi:Rrf2 family protein